jgi:hypothetical protein
MKYLSFLIVLTVVFAFFSCKDDQTTVLQSSDKNVLTQEIVKVYSEQSTSITWRKPVCSNIGSECYTYAVIRAFQSDNDGDDDLLTCSDESTILDPMMDDLPYNAVPPAYFTYIPYDFDDVEFGDIIEFTGPGHHVAFVGTTYKYVYDRNRVNDVQLGPSPIADVEAEQGSAWRIYKISDNIDYPDPPDPPPPPAPYILGEMDPNHPYIYWEEISNADSYKIYKRRDSSYPWDPYGTYTLHTTIEGIEYTDYSEYRYLGSGPKVKVYYKVVATNEQGDSDFSNYKQFTVKLYDF